MDENNKKDSFDIPSFVNKKEQYVTEEDNDIDMSVFQLDEDEQEELRNTKRPKRERNNAPIIILAVIAILVAAGGIAFGVHIYNAKQEEQLRLEEEKKKEEEAQKAAEEQKRKEEEEAAALEAERQKNLGNYMVQVNVRLRTQATTDSDVVDYDSLPDSLKEQISESMLPEGIVVEVLEYVDDTSKNMKWGRIADNVWFCIQNGEDVYAVKEN